MKRLFKSGTKRIGLFVLCLLLTWSAVPWWNLPQVNAAEEDPEKYFYFTNDALQKSKADDPYVYTLPVIDLEGTFFQVNSNDIKVRVEQIYKASDGTYQVVEGSFYTRDVNVPSGNQFEINGLTLFEGLNRLILYGTSGGVTVQDEFYILFDNAPFIQDLLIQTNTDDPKPLKAGFGTVVTSRDAFIQGVVPNAKTIIINGEYSVQPYEDGMFFAPIIRLNPGKNVIDITVKGTNQEFTVQRTVYYFDSQKMVYEGWIKFDDDPDEKQVVGEKQTFSIPMKSQSTAEAVFKGKIMTRHKGSDLTKNSLSFSSNTIAVDTGSLNVSSPTAITYDSDGAIEFATYDVTFNMTVTINVYGDPIYSHSLEIKTDYPLGGDIEGSDELDFRVAASDEDIVENVQWLYEYPDESKKMPLNNAQINNSTIYVVVDKNRDYDGTEQLEVYLTPVGVGNNIVATQEKVLPENDKAIYKLENIPEGNHTLVFKFKDAPSVYDYLVNINYVSSVHALFTNVYDGMILKSDNKPAKLMMMFRTVPENFDPKSPANILSINGEVINGALNGYVKPNEEFEVQGYDSTKLVNGENIIKLELQLAGYKITQVLRIYVISSNLPSIDQFKPVLPPPLPGQRPDLGDPTDREYMYKDTTGFIIKDQIYFTYEKKFDLLIEATNYKRVQLQHDGDIILEYERLSGVTKQDYAIDVVQQNPKVFIRVKDIKFESTGSMVFILKVTNDDSSQATQRLEIVREAVPYIIKSPKSANGGDIIVNKNFVKVKIQAEAADRVVVEKQEAVKSTDPNCTDCYEVEYMNLKPNKWNEIKFSVFRGSSEVKGSVKVFYANTNVEGAQYKEPLDKKHSMFNGALQLEFEKGTLLRSAVPINGIYNLYEGQHLLFGIADPETGMVEEITDEGVVKTPKAILKNLFERHPDTFTFISPIFWINGGLGELGTPGTADYEPKLHGLPPHNDNMLLTYTRVDKKRSLVPTKRGELTLKYDENLRESSGVIVTVFYFDEDGNWVNMGGIIDEKKHEITIPFDKFGYYAVAKLRYSFSDIQNHPWARDVLQALYAKGFMNNIRFNEFGSDDYITRGEFAQLLVRALQLPLTYDDRNTFLDVQPGSRYGNLWEYKYIETAARAGIVHGLENRIFGPNMRLTREQAAVMIARALEFKLPANDEKLEAKLKKDFTDFGNINYYARPAVMTVNKEGIMVGKPNVTSGGTGKPTFRFDPLSNLTRAEAGAVAVRIMQQELKYFPKNLR